MDRIHPIVSGSPLKACAASAIVISLSYFTAKALHKLFKRDDALPCPPGPPREFFLGALRSFPKGYPLERFNEWAVAYGIHSPVSGINSFITSLLGEIVYAPLPGKNIVILNSHEIAQDLLSKRPSSTAGRRYGYVSCHL
jgi:hypothetical protein